MSSPGQKRWACDHVMANFDAHSSCTLCIDKGKGKDPSVEQPETKDCKFCNSLTPEQRLQLATPSYKLKNEKLEAKKLESTPSKDSDTLVDPASASVIGVVSDQGASKSPAMATPPEKKSKKEKSTKSAGTKIDTDSKIQELDQKWSERVNLSSDLPSWSLLLLSFMDLAPLLSYSISRPVKLRPVYQQVCGPHLLCFLVRASLLPISRPVKPEQVYHLLPQCFLVRASLLHSIIRPVKLRLRNLPQLPGTGSSASQHQPTSKVQSHRPTSSERSSQDVSASKQLSSSKLKPHRPHSDRPKASGTDPLASRCHSTGKLQTDQPLSSDVTDTGSPMLHRSRKDSFSSVSSEPEIQASNQPPLDIYVEEGELSDDQHITVTDQEQHLSEEQTYREKMRGIRSFMGWSHIPDMDSATNTSEDNPFAGPKTPVPGKMLVLMPTEEWLCRKLSKLNLTLIEGYPSRGLSKDVFLRPAKSQSKWYGLFSDHKVDPSAISSWSTDTSKLNHSYSRIARHPGLSSTPPASRHISQESLRKWEKSVREASVICNQAASFNRCLFKVQ